MATVFKRGTLYMGDEPLGIGPMPRKYDYKNTPKVSIRDTVQGKELRWVPLPNGLWVAKIPLLNYISWNDLERNGFVDGKVVSIDERRDGGSN